MRVQIVECEKILENVNIYFLRLKKNKKQINNSHLQFIVGEESVLWPTKHPDTDRQQGRAVNSLLKNSLQTVVSQLTVVLCDMHILNQ